VKILAVDTATMECSVGVYHNGAALFEMTQARGRTHSVRLMVMIDQALRGAGHELNQIDCLAVGTGPGSFTGIRIGISTVKGLSQGSGKPVIGVSSLDALAFQAGACKWPVYAMIDARKGQVYSAMYCFQKKRMKRSAGVIVTAPDRILGDIHQAALFIGSGALAYQNLIQQVLDGKAHFPDTGAHTIKAVSIARVAEKLFKKDGAGDAGSIGPDYIRRSDAEINLTKKRPGNH
jgi:tRNA threonylcarbamoyladenosine biosynthesis protein TsaB